MNIFQQHKKNIQTLIDNKTASMKAEREHLAKMISMCEEAIKKIN